METADGLDEILMKLGTGKWNYLFFSTVLLVEGLLPVFLVGAEFINALPSYSCDIPDNNRTRPLNGSQCVMVEEDSAGLEKIVPCENWIYDKSIFHSTIAMEWNLVCDRSWLLSFFQYIHVWGRIPGAFLSGITADRFGRRLTLIAGTLCVIISVMVMAIVPWIWLIMLLRFLLGVFTGLIFGPAYDLAMEICYPSQRSTIMILAGLPNGLMMSGLAALAYFIRDWRLLQFAACSPCLILLVASYLVDESPRWLIAKGRLDEAIKILQRGLRLNQPKLSEELDIKSSVYRIHQMSENESCATSSNALGLDDGFGPLWAGPAALLRTKVVRKITLVMVVIYLLQGVVYLGLPLNSDSFSSPFLYVFLLGVFELPAYTIPAPVTRWIGRKAVLLICFIACGVVLLGSLPLASFISDKIHLVIVTTCSLMITTGFQVNLLYAPELFPTTLRPFGTAACNIFLGLGYGIASFIIDYGGKEFEWFTPTVLGSFSIIAGLLVLPLPETNKRSLPETVADLQKWTAEVRPGS